MTTPGRTIGAGGIVVALQSGFVKVRLARGRCEWFRIEHVERATACEAARQETRKAWKARQAKKNREERKRRDAARRWIREGNRNDQAAAGGSGDLGSTEDHSGTGGEA